MFKISCNKFLNAAGPWAGYLVQPIGVDLPVRPRKRYVFAFDCPKGPKDMLLAVDPSGCWFRKEGSGSLYICGKSPNEVSTTLMQMNRSGANEIIIRGFKIAGKSGNIALAYWTVFVGHSS